MPIFRPISSALAAAFLALACLPLNAEEHSGDTGSSSDPLPGICPGFELGEAIPPAPDRDSAPIVIKARELDAARGGEGIVSGNVELFRADQHIATEHLIFDDANQLITVPGPISYQDSQVWLRGSEARYSLVEESGYFSVVNFGLTGMCWWASLQKTQKPPYSSGARW